MSGGKAALGIDLGGTNLRMGVVRSTGELVDFAAQPIDAEAPGDRIVAEISRLAHTLPHLDQVEAVGIALAAVVQPGQPIERELTNLRGLHHYPLVEQVAQALGLPCAMENDALLALLGEARFGAARGRRDVALLTLGTGIGGAFLLDGVLRKGTRGMGCEIGMLPFPDPTMDSLTALELIAAPKAVMARLGGPGDRLYERVAAGEARAQAAAQAMHRHLGWLVTALQLSLDLELVLLGGGLAAAGQPLLDGVRAAFQSICPPGLQFGLRIELGSLPQHAAGVIGAAGLVLPTNALEIG